MTAACDLSQHVEKAIFTMDPKYYSLVEIVAFAAFAGGFCVYQIWSVRRNSEEAPPPTDDVTKPPDSDGKT